MKNSFLFGGLFALLLVFAACDSGGSADADSNGDTELKDSELAEMSDLVVSSFDDLPVCTDARGSTTAYVKEEKKAYACDGADWAVDATLTDSIRKVRDKKNESTKSKSGKGKGASAGSIYDAENNTLTDLRDGHVYKTVRIGAEIWMAENLKYAYLGKTKELDSSSFCYNNSLEYCEKYGRYYLWSAAMDSAGIIPGNVANHCGDNRSSGATCECGENSRYIRGACPEGWYLPIRWDWQTLLIATDSNETSLRSANISNELKEACVELNTKNERNTSGCDSLGGSDKFGFGELPVGIVTGGDGYYGVHFFGLHTDYWSLDFSQSGAYYMSRYYIWHGGPGGADPYDGLPIRCVKDPRVPPCKTETEDHCEYGTLTDERDGQTYKTVKIGEQWWMAENLNYAYPGGTMDMDSSSFCPIHVSYRNLVEKGFSGNTDFWKMDWEFYTSVPYCFNDVLDTNIECPYSPESCECPDISWAYCEKYGRLYMWSAAVDSAGIIPGNTAVNCDYRTNCLSGIRGVCPKGWHLPDSTEWLILYKATIRDGLDSLGVLRSTTGWDDYGLKGTDAYGFSALPAVSGTVRKLRGGWQLWWSSSGYDRYATHYTRTTYAPGFNSSLLFFETAADWIADIFSVASVRCVKD
jgi:uncharacterized protein (TIGR02145 family)